MSASIALQSHLHHATSHGTASRIPLLLNYLYTLPMYPIHLFTYMFKYIFVCATQRAYVWTTRVQSTELCCVQGWCTRLSTSISHAEPDLIIIFKIIVFSSPEIASNLSEYPVILTWKGEISELFHPLWFSIWWYPQFASLILCDFSTSGNILQPCRHLVPTIRAPASS